MAGFGTQDGRFLVFYSPTVVKDVLQIQTLSQIRTPIKSKQPVLATFE